MKPDKDKIEVTDEEFEGMPEPLKKLLLATRMLGGEAQIGTFKLPMEEHKSDLESHYGVKKGFTGEECKKMICDMIMNTNKTITIDKWFPELNGEGRLRVLAFHFALSKIEKLKED